MKMSLTKIDLKKLVGIIRIESEQNNEKLFERLDKFIIKDAFSEFKDTVCGIRKELNTEHKIRQLRIKENTVRINRLENKIEKE